MAQLFPWQNIGFEVAAVFTSAREALEYIAHDPVDVVLTDIEMPDMNGLELSRRLMDCPQIEKVFFSSYSNYEYFRTALQNGVADYLMKPVAYSALLECFERSVPGWTLAAITARKAQGLIMTRSSTMCSSISKRTTALPRWRSCRQGQPESGVSLPRVQGQERRGFSELLLRTRMERPASCWLTSSTKATTSLLCGLR